MPYPPYDETGFDFDEIADVYQALGALNPPSELLGLWCGRLVGGVRWSDQDVLDVVVEHMEVDRIDEPENEALFVRIFRKMEAALAKDDLSFNLILPDENYPIEDRLTALGQWVRGFLEGLALEKGAELVIDNEENHELLSDLVEISNIEIEVEDDDSSEMQLVEVIEHVRMTVMSLYQDFCPVYPGSMTDQPTIH
ncbi:MAG: YecA family protein [Proteobacteria bacterium]|nr:MAG: YecA family protein [Pseudomonadota bacterium]PIE40516.1 MAG: YecA family protein [Gammaproteobacteria bacterium]